MAELPDRNVTDFAGIRRNFDALKKLSVGKPSAALPTTGLFDGREAMLQTPAMQLAGVAWRMRYRALNADGSPNLNALKWEFVGGPLLWSAQVNPVQSVAFGTAFTFTAMGVAEASLVAPATGFYELSMHSYADTPSTVRELRLYVADPTNAVFSGWFASATWTTLGEPTTLAVTTTIGNIVAGFPAGTTMLTRAMSSVAGGIANYRGTRFAIRPIALA